MKKIMLVCTALCTLCTIIGCASQRVSTIVGGEYDAKKDVTDYFVFPFGNVSIPGKWEKCGYVKTGRQQFFRNQDSVLVAVAFGRVEHYEWNKDGALKGPDFLTAFYEWESDYFKSNGYESHMIETDSVNQYILYRVFGEKANTYFLVGVKSNGNVSNLSVNYTDKWTEEEKIFFLKNLFLSK